MKYLTATGDRVIRAYNSSIRKVQKDKDLISTEVSAGFVIPDGQPKGPKKGFQVFVKVCAYDEARLKAYPNTGGLLNN